MWLQFFLENLHFAVNIFAALVIFAVFWLYYDAWTQRKDSGALIKIAGFLLLSVSYLFAATTIESAILPVSQLSSDLFPSLKVLLRLSGYILIIVGVVKEPLQKHPKHKKSQEDTLAPVLLFSGGSTLVKVLQLPLPFLSFLTGFLYLRRATRGYENHLKRIAIGFFLLAAGELISLTQIFRDTQNVNLYNLVAPFGPAWILEHLVLLIAALIIGHWVWGYLLKRLVTQLFMIFTLASLVIFLITTVSFSALLIKNLQDETLGRLETDVKVLSLAIDSKKDEILSDSEILAKDTKVKEGIEAGDQNILAISAESLLLTKKLSTTIIVNENGLVLARGEDKERIGGSLSEDSLVQRALSGEPVTSIIVKSGVVGPEITVRAVSPIETENGILGAVVTSEILDNAFVDSIKKATGLEVGIYGGDLLSASTILGPDGKSRSVGVLLANDTVKKEVLDEGKSFTGSTTLFNTSYFGAYLSLKDIDDVPVGMLFVGKPQIAVLQTAGKSIEFTFLFAAALIVLSIIPAQRIARHIARQLR